MHYSEGYNSPKCCFLQLGLVNGFSLHYKGPDIFSSHKNHNSANEQPNIVDFKLAEELHLNRIEGVFLHPPFQNLNISPIGFVQQKEHNSFRLIHDLSYPCMEMASVLILWVCEYCEYCDCEYYRYCEHYSYCE
jgi:hypothetical protein